MSKVRLRTLALRSRPPTSSVRPSTARTECENKANGQPRCRERERGVDRPASTSVPPRLLDDGIEARGRWISARGYWKRHRMKLVFIAL